MITSNINFNTSHSLIRPLAKMTLFQRLPKNSQNFKRFFSKFNIRDPFNLESLLTEEEIIIQKNAAAYCQEKLMPRVLMGNRHGKFDREIMREMGQLGLLGATIKGYVISDFQGIIHSHVPMVIFSLIFLDFLQIRLCRCVFPVLWSYCP